MIVKVKKSNDLRVRYEAKYLRGELTIVSYHKTVAAGSENIAHGLKSVNVFFCHALHYYAYVEYVCI